MTQTVYTRLMMGEGLGEHFDRHVFACAIAVCRHAPADSSAGALPPLTAALGLGPDQLCALFAKYFPHALDVLPWMHEAEGAGEDSIEEPDLRDLLLSHRAGRSEDEGWLAAIVARRSLCENHLWQDLGLQNRDELNALMARHFPTLKALNAGNMKWKKFFYRTLCQTDGVIICKSPHCEACDDFDVCFGEESGESLMFRVSNEKSIAQEM